MADIKKFLDQQGTTYLWSKIKAQLDTKADASRVTTLEGKVTTLEASVYNDTEVRGLIQDNADDIDGLDTRVTTAEGKITTLEGQASTLIGSDTNKSVRTIANEELATQLIPASAAESLDTLQEIAAWIQAHPGDAATMNSAINALQTKLTLGTDASTEQEYATVKAYVEAYVGAAVAATHTHDNKAVLDGITATLISNWNEAYTKAHEHANKAVLDGITSAKVTAWDAAEQNAKDYAAGLASNYATSAQGAKADTALQPADVVGLTTAEIDTAIANANQPSGD